MAGSGGESGIRLLAPGDEARLEAFLRRHASSSLFLRSNVAAGGLANRGERFQGTYAAAFEDGEIVAVASHCWNGLLLLQAPSRLTDVARAAALTPPAGFLGPWEQVVAARAALGLQDAPLRCESPEDLFELPLTDLRLPRALKDERVTVRRLQPEDLDDFTAMQVEYQVEALGAERDPELAASERAKAERGLRDGTSFIARCEGRTVAVSLFNATLPDCVQIGGVFTPPGMRGHGFARAVVGGSLGIARDEGVALAVLFTGKDNEPARRAYLSLGFRIIGDYGIVLLA